MGMLSLQRRMKDEKFIDRINGGEKFARGDVLRVRMPTIQRQTRRGLRSERTIIKVLEHIRSQRLL